MDSASVSLASLDRTVEPKSARTSALDRDSAVTARHASVIRDSLDLIAVSDCV